MSDAVISPPVASTPAKQRRALPERLTLRIALPILLGACGLLWFAIWTMIASFAG
jgi:hypothetical protein